MPVLAIYLHNGGEIVAGRYIRDTCTTGGKYITSHPDNKKQVEIE